MTSLATSNRTALSYSPETVFGTTDATPAFTPIRYTGESMNYNIRNIKSQEIRADRNTTDLVQVQADAAGDINFELSYASFDDFIEAAICGTWTGDVLKNGTVLRSFTIQKYFQDPTTPFYKNYRGMRIGGMDLSFQTGQILTGKFSTMGLSADAVTSQIAGATLNTASTTDVMNAVTNLTDIKDNGITSTNYFNKLTLTLNNNLRAQRAIGSLANVGIALGSLDLTGSIELFLQDKSLVDRYLAGTFFSLQLTVADSTPSSYDILLPKVKFETGQVVSGGLDQDVMLTGNIRAIYDSAETCAIKVTRTP